MQLRRTANAGFLLTLDGVTIAMDGVCREVPPYSATPPAERDRLLAAPPDLLAFTHAHADHFDPAFAAAFAGTIVAPAQLSEALAGRPVTDEPVTCGRLRITPVPTRHIGSSCLTTAHCSFMIEGSQRLWFLGDAAPAQLRLLRAYGRPDVMIAPFAYATTPAAVRMVNEAAPRALVLTHLPPRSKDPDHLCAAVDAMLPHLQMPTVIPDLGQTVTI